MCLGTLSVLYPLNLLFFKVIFYLTPMALMAEIPNSWVHRLPREKTWTLNFRSVNMSGGQLSVFLKKDFWIFLEILHEARES